MKKYIAMILTLILALSLCACGDNNDSKTNDNIETESTIEQVSPAEPGVPNLNMFEGSWKALSSSTVVPNDGFSINADGTMKYHGKEYTWTADELPASSQYEMEITAIDDNENCCYTIRLKRTSDNTYVANFRNFGNVMGSGKDYYREADYTVIELTEENVLDYVETEIQFVFETNKDGYTKAVSQKTYIRFKSTVGCLSEGNVNFKTKDAYRDVQFEAKPENYTLGEIKSESNSSMNGVWLIGEAESYCYTVTWYVDNPGEAFARSFSFSQLIGADWCNGRVFLLNQ